MIKVGQMIRPSLAGILVIVAGHTRLTAGEEQAFFLAHVRDATKATISHRPEKGGPAEIVLDTNEQKTIEQVVSAIEMEDRKPEKTENGEEVIRGSVLTFGVADYIITFYRADKKVGEYGMQQDANFITPLGEHASKAFIDLPLTEKSSAAMKHLLATLK